MSSLRDGDIPFTELAKMVGSKLTAEPKSDLGALGWHFTTVELELEVIGEVARKQAVSPQVVMLGSVETG